MAKILYHAVPVDWRKEQKFQFLDKAGSLAGVKWQQLAPDKRGNWITDDLSADFDTFLPVGLKNEPAPNEARLFEDFSTGLMTQRDSVVYGFERDELVKSVKSFAKAYNAEVARYLGANKPKDVDGFVDCDALKWSRNLKRHLARGAQILFAEGNIREAIYRPFCKRHLYFAPIINDERGKLQSFLPNKATEKENRLIWLKVGAEVPFHAMMVSRIPDRLPQCGSQCFPLFTYSEDGKEQQDNVTLNALVRFQNFYGDDALTRADVFYYVYAVLHHPAYRTRYAENLKRELPRIPLIAADGTLHAPPLPGVAADVRRLHSPTGKTAKKSEPPHVGCYESDAAVFHAFAAAGRKLADLHVHYESAPEFPLQRIENKEVPLDWRVEVMKLSKGKASLLYNDFLTLTGIPPEVFDYRLGNRSALDWVIDQYRVSRDEHGKVTSDPNRLDDEQYIVRLLGQVITVSLETQKIVQGLPKLRFDDEGHGK